LSSGRAGASGRGRVGAATVALERMPKKVVYVDMDNVLVDFPSAFSRVPEGVLRAYEGRLDEIPGIFSFMEPVAGALPAFEELAQRFDTYVLSTSPWENPSAWSDKLLWVKQHLGAAAYKRLILSHHKNLNAGDFLIDDRTKNGADRFLGEHILFGSEAFPDWPTVMAYLRAKAD
jgi:5'-nucleotidase